MSALLPFSPEEPGKKVEFLHALVVGGQQEFVTRVLAPKLRELKIDVAWVVDWEKKSVPNLPKKCDVVLIATEMTGHQLSIPAAQKAKDRGIPHVFISRKWVIARQQIVETLKLNVVEDSVSKLPHADYIKVASDESRQIWASLTDSEKAAIRDFAIGRSDELHPIARTKLAIYLHGKPIQILTTIMRCLKKDDRLSMPDFRNVYYGMTGKETTSKYIKLARELVADDTVQQEELVEIPETPAPIPDDFLAPQESVSVEQIREEQEPISLSGNLEDQIRELRDMHELMTEELHRLQHLLSASKRDELTVDRAIEFLRDKGFSISLSCEPKKRG